MITLPGQTHIIVWNDPESKEVRAIAPDDIYKWYGAIDQEADPPNVTISKKCSLAPHANVHITATLEKITIETDDIIVFSLLEASDFSITMIEAIRTLKAAEAHAKGELYGPHSDGDIRYE